MPCCVAIEEAAGVVLVKGQVKGYGEIVDLLQAQQVRVAVAMGTRHHLSIDGKRTLCGAPGWPVSPLEQANLILSGELPGRLCLRCRRSRSLEAGLTPA